MEARGEVSRRCPDWVLKIYGKGDKSEYMRLAERYGLRDNCALEDTVGNIHDKYYESLISVLSSRFEGFGVVLIEAISWGLSVVSFVCPYGPRDIITKGYDELLAEKEDIPEPAEKIIF